MEKCFGYFGVRTHKGLSSSLGLNDEQIQLQEIEDIETTMPDAKIVMIEPQPLGKLVYEDLGFHYFFRYERTARCTFF